MDGRDKMVSIPRRDKLVSILREHIVKVVFKKVGDGSTRVMYCTLIKEFLPVVEEGHTVKKTKQSEKVVVVWDLDVEAWRSFRVENIIEVEKI